MKLIELLVQKLPKRGGWPDGVRNIEMFASGMIFFDGDCAPKEFNLPQCSDGWEKGMGRNYTNAVTREQYEAALAAAQQSVWDGEGLPPVGMHCEIVDPDGALMYGQGESGEVVAHVEDTAVIRMSYGLGCFEARCLRPARSEADKKRAEVSQMITDIFYTLNADNNYLRGEGVYDAIAAGEVKGVKLDV